ncbi:MAG: biopolymer transporter ExbD [Agarilytica sp.]
MKLKRKRAKMEATVELNITAFMNLMVILVPFLLITAVFSRMTVLELNLPNLDAKSKDNEEIKLQLQVLVTSNDLVVKDANLGEFRRIPLLENGQEWGDKQRKVWKPLREILVELKTRFPEEQSIALLLDRSVSYRSMIEVMDRVRAADIVTAGTVDTYELFPQVSIGDIPEEPSAQTAPAEVGVAQP